MPAICVVVGILAVSGNDETVSTEWVGFWYAAPREPIMIKMSLI